MRSLKLTLRALHLVWIAVPTTLAALVLGWTTGGRKRLYRIAVRGLERAGATFIKLGQIASSRPDLISPDLCEALAKLHDNAPAHSGAVSRRMIEEAFGRPVEEIFSEFDDRAIASGSIAQVHAGRLRDGTKVAVKVRHPTAASVIDTDLAIIRGVARLLDKLPSMKWLGLPDSAAQFSRTMANQLDLELEARHLKIFAENFRDWPAVHFPQPIDGLVSETVLVETFEEGVPISHYVAIDHPGKPELARLGLDVLLKMVFEDGFVHADLHPGNIFVRETPDAADRNFDVILLDVGMVAELPGQHKENFTYFFASIAAGNGRDAAMAMIEHSPMHDCRDPEAFARDVERIFQPLLERPLSEIEVAGVLSQVMNTVRKHRIRTESAFTSVNVGMMVLEGLGRQLDPNLNLLEIAGPRVIAMLQESTTATPAA